MIPPIFPVCAASPTVIALLGSSPTRIYPFGLVRENRPARPYAVWQTIGGAPEIFINQRPDVDFVTTQVDVYAESDSGVIQVATALRDAIEGRAHITRWGQQDLEEDTGLYRISFDVDWITPR